MIEMIMVSAWAICSFLAAVYILIDIYKDSELTIRIFAPIVFMVKLVENSGKIMNIYKK